MVTLNRNQEQLFLAVKYIEESGVEGLKANVQTLMTFVKGQGHSKYALFLSSYDDVFGSLPKITKFEVEYCLKSLVNNYFVGEINGDYFIVNHNYDFFSELSAYQQKLALEIIKIIEDSGLGIKRIVSLRSITYKEQSNKYFWFRIGFDVSGNYVLWGRTLPEKGYSLKTFCLDDSSINESLVFVNSAINMYKTSHSGAKSSSYIISDQDILDLLK